MIAEILSFIFGGGSDAEILVLLAPVPIRTDKYVVVLSKYVPPTVAETTTDSPGPR